MNFNTESGRKRNAGRTSPVEFVLSRLENVSNLSSGWNALCPAHDDNMNSLSVGEGVDGRALLFCHAGCSLNEVVGAMGIRVRDLFVQRRGRR